MAYATSTQLYNWHFSAADLANQRQDCNAAARKRFESQESPCSSKEVASISLDSDEELRIVKRHIFLMKVFFDQFTEPRLPDEVYGFGVTYFKRFYLNHSVMDFQPREMMLTCLYMACKASDFPVGLQAFISHIPRNQERYSYFILNSELFLLEALRYDLWVFTPYRPFLGLVTDLEAYQKRVRQSRTNSSVCKQHGSPEFDERQLVTELCKEGTDLINLWYQTDLCLTVHPSQFALAVLVEIGRTRPQLDVETFVRDELCGCDPMEKKPDQGRSRTSRLKQENNNILDDNQEDSDDSDAADQKPPIEAVSSEDHWKQVSSKLDFIRELINEFQFMTELGPMNEEEHRLDRCRNPLYDMESTEYAEAKSKADSLLETLE